MASKSPARGLIKPSAAIDHLNRYLGTWSGFDKAMMTFQYSSILVTWALRLRRRKSRVAEGLSKMSGRVADARILCDFCFPSMVKDFYETMHSFRFFGLVQTFQWIASLEDPAAKTASAASHLLQRLEAWTLAAYYPLEHIYYLGAHAIIPLSAARLLKIGLWSCRFWAAYVLFEFLHLAERARLCRVAESELQSKQTEKGDLDESLAIQSTRANIRSNLLINSAYFPLTLHWSLEKGLYGNEAWTGLFGTIAALEQWRLGWAATA